MAAVARLTLRTGALVATDKVDAGAAVVTSALYTVVEIDLAHGTGSAGRTRADEVVSDVKTLAIVQARLVLALVHVKLTVSALSINQSISQWIHQSED